MACRSRAYHFALAGSAAGIALLMPMSFIAFPGCSGPARRGELVAPTASSASPRLTVTPSTLDLGTAEPGDELRGFITLKNAGTGLLRLKELAAGCGCAQLDLADDTIPAGGRTRLRVTLRVRAEGQHLQFPVRISSNDPAAPQTICIVKGEAAAPVLRTDPAELDFGEVTMAGSPVKPLRLLKPDGSALPPEERVSLELEHGSFLVKETAPSRNRSGRAAVIELRPRPDLPPGPFSETLTLRLSDGRRPVQVAIKGTVVPPLLVAPTGIYNGDVDPRSGPVKRFLIVRRTDGKPLRRLVKTEAPPGVLVEETNQGQQRAGASTKRFLVTLRPAAVTRDVPSGKLSLWFAGEPEPVTVGVMIFLAKKTARSDP